MFRLHQDGRRSMDDKNSTWCTVIDSNPLGQNNRPRPVWSKPHPVQPPLPQEHKKAPLAVLQPMAVY